MVDITFRPLIITFTSAGTRFGGGRGGNDNPMGQTYFKLSSYYTEQETRGLALMT